MKNKQYPIQLPNEMIDHLKLEKNTSFYLQVENHKIKIQKKMTDNSVIYLWWFLIPSLIASIGFYSYFYMQGLSQIKLTGEQSIATLVIILGFFSGIVLFTIFFIRGKRSNYSTLKDIYWRNFPALLISFGIILVLSIIGFFWTIGVLFEGASFDLMTSTFIALTFFCIINYLMIYLTLSISSQMITILLICIIIGGVLLSMISNSQLQWWQFNFSFLGTDKANGSWQFNLTLIVSALLMIALIDYLFVVLQKSLPKNTRLTILRILLLLTALDLGSVGFFPNNGSGQLHMLHNQVANFLVYLILILIIGIRWLLPQVKKEFLTISYLIGAILFVANILFQGVGYLSLTAFELIAFLLAFSWILLLLQNIQRLVTGSSSIYFIELE